MSLEQLVIWILVGAIAGFLADAAIKRVNFGLLGDIVVGILGAILGGWIFEALGVSIGLGIIGSIIVAFVGALILLLVLSAVNRRGAF